MAEVSKNQNLAETKIKSKNSDVFRISARRFHLTYKTHIEPERWLKWVREKFSKAKLYSIVQEIGDEKNDYPHTHILIDFVEKIDSKNCHIFDYKLEENNEYWFNQEWYPYQFNRETGAHLNEDVQGIHPNIKTVGKDNDYWNYVAFEYHRKQLGSKLFTNILTEEQKKEIKEDEKRLNCRRCENPAFARKHTCGIAEYKEKKEVEKKAVLGLKELQKRINEDRNFNAVEHYGGADIKSIATIEKAMNYIRKPLRSEPKILWKPWQMKKLEKLSQKALDRLIYWIWDQAGKTGKSDFIDHLVEFYGVLKLDHLILSTVGLEVKKAYAKGQKNITHIFIDLPRGYKMTKECYQTLELLKSGKITSHKYDSSNVRFMGETNDKPHVVVFSNELPNFDCLTPDKLGLEIIDKRGIDVSGENIIPVTEIKLPEGYQKPGTIIVENQQDRPEDLYYKPFKFEFTKKEEDFSLKFWTDYAIQEEALEIEKQKLLNERKILNLQRTLNNVSEEAKKAFGGEITNAQEALK